MTEERNPEAVLVLGAYGLVGREIVRGLAELGHFTIIAAGRDRKKLDALAAGAKGVSVLELDARDADAMKREFSKVGLIVNCVGPYALGGIDVARAAVRGGANYLDFANEQAHYNRLRDLDEAARMRGLFLLTAAGLVPGVSTMLISRAARVLPSLRRVEVYYVEGRRPDPEAGLAGVMSGIVETGFTPVFLRKGRLRPMRVGSTARYEKMPKPFGKTFVVSVPGIDLLTVPPKMPMRRMNTYFGMHRPPPGFLQLMRILRLQNHPTLYAIVRKFVARAVRSEHRRAEKKGIGPEGVMKIYAADGRKQVVFYLHVEDGGKGAAVMPIVCVARWAEGLIKRGGLITPLDLFDEEMFFRDAAAVGRPLVFTEKTGPMKSGS